MLKEENYSNKNSGKAPFYLFIISISFHNLIRFYVSLEYLTKENEFDINANFNNPHNNGNYYTLGSAISDIFIIF